MTMFTILITIIEINMATKFAEFVSIFLPRVGIELLIPRTKSNKTNTQMDK